MNAKITEFIFRKTEDGWQVVYQSFPGKRAYTALIHDEELIKATKGTPFPKAKHLKELRRLVKQKAER